MDINLVLGSAGGIFSLLKTVKDTNDAMVRSNAVFEIHGKFMDLIAAHDALVAAKREIEAKLAACETWERESARYKLHDFGGGTFAYIVKEAERGSEPAHSLCANCYSQAKKSILQFKFRGYDSREQWRCPACQQDFAFGNASPSAAGYMDDI